MGALNPPWVPPFPNNVALRSRRTDGTLEDVAKIDAFERVFLGNPNLTMFLQGAGFSQPVNSIQLKPFISALQTITSGGALTIAHGLTGATKFWAGVTLQCVTAEAGCGVGARIIPQTTQHAGSNRGFVSQCDGTNIYVRFGADGNAFEALNYGTGAAVALTNANWRAEFTVWAIA